MSASAEQDKSRFALTAALSKGVLPAAAHELGTKLLAQLETPIRVTLLGLPGAGKSAVLALLLGQRVVPEGTPMPTTEIKAALEPTTRLTLSDGTTQTLQGIDSFKIMTQSPAFVQLGLSLPALNKISVLEVVTSQDRVEQIRAMKWAAKRTDIAIWCTQTYEGSEHALWQDMPDTLKDHAFLVRTKADELDAGAPRQKAISDLTGIAGDHFAHVMGLATLDAIAARRSDGSTDKDMLRASGGIALISTIMRQIDLGRQSTVDQVAMLLHRHKLADVDAQQAVPVSKPATPAPETVPDAPTTPVAAAPIATAPIATAPDTAAPIVTDVPDDTSVAKTGDDLKNVIEEAGSATSAAPLPDDVRAIFNTAAERLGQLSTSLGADPEWDALAVITTADEELETLSDALDSVDVPDLPQLAQLRAVTLDAQDMAQLMKLERDDHAAFDAVTLLVQIRRQLLQFLDE